MLALAAASAAHAGVLIPPSGETNLFDLVHDNVGTSAASDPLAIAGMGLQTTAFARLEASFTGPVDRSAAAGTAFPLVPLNAAPGTPPDEDFATQYTGTWHWNAWQKALAIGVAQVAPLIGHVGNGPSLNDRPGSTVFVAESSQPGFDRERATGSVRRSTAANALGPGSTSTATMTVTGLANFPRAGSGFAVAGAMDAQPLAAASEQTPVGGEAPTPSYHYAPQPSPAAKSNMMVASFGGAVTVAAPTGHADTGPGASDLRSMNGNAAIYARSIAMTIPIDGDADATRPDGTRRFLPASVSANPAAAAAQYVARVLDAALAGVSEQTVEAFQIGPIKAARTPGGAAASVTDPLQGKILAGVGPLDNALALP